MVEVADFHQKVLRRSSSPEELQIYRAGLEWDLTDPIVIESAEDFKSAPRWKDRLTPYYHQVTTGLSVHSSFLTGQDSRLRPLFDLLNDVNRLPDGKDYPVIEGALARKMNGVRSKIVSGAISPTKNALAVCAKVKHLFGLKTNYIGFVFSPFTREVVGMVAQGKRTKQGWFED